MKKTLTIGLFLPLMILASCGQQSTDSNTTASGTKQNFTVQTASLVDFGTDISAEKSAVIQANSTLDIPAEAAGKISKIFVKEGQTLRAGATIATIADTVTNYDLMLTQAKNNIGLQNAANEAQLVNLDNGISSAQMQYDKALQAYKQLLGRNDLKYDNLVKKNQDTLDSYNDTYRQQLSALEAMMTQQLHEADKILGMTSNFQYANNSWENYLGAANGEGMATAQDSWNVIYTLR